jgi:hypothetical protein
MIWHYVEKFFSRKISFVCFILLYYFLDFIVFPFVYINPTRVQWTNTYGKRWNGPITFLKVKSKRIFWRGGSIRVYCSSSKSYHVFLMCQLCWRVERQMCEMVLFHLDKWTELQQLIQGRFITVLWSAVIRDAGGIDRTVVVKSTTRAIRESTWELSTVTVMSKWFCFSCLIIGEVL